MFCIRNPDKRTMNLDLAFGSIETATIFQNAGCTMAIHADCTKAKIRINITD
jgi:hypothetical protein